MRKLILSMHVTLDGFVAGPNGEMDWIKLPPGLFDFVGEMTARADGALYGRVTYEMMNAYWPTAGSQPDASKHDKEHSEWYNSVTRYVLSRTMAGAALPKTKIISDDIAANVKAIKQEAGKNIMIFGSPSASHTLTAQELIDDYWLFINPVLLGKGIPLFKNVTHPMNLELVESKPFNMGVIGLHYSRV